MKRPSIRFRFCRGGAAPPASTPQPLPRIACDRACNGDTPLLSVKFGSAPARIRQAMVALARRMPAFASAA